MTIESVQAIEEFLKEISKQLQIVRILPDIADQQHGQEREYLAGNLKKECRSIIERLSTVLDSEAGFLNISNYQSRQELRNKLDELRSSLLQLNSRGPQNNTDEIEQVFRSIDELKRLTPIFEKILPAEQLEQINKMREDDRKVLNQIAGNAVAEAFKQRAKIASERKFWALPLTGATFFIIAAVVAVYFLFIHNIKTEEISFAQTLPRIAITSILVTPGVFCLRQYIRHRNILDDYNYKVAVAESIDPVLAVLDDTRDQGIYLKTAFEAIHQHPLAKNHEPHTSIRRLLDHLKPFDHTNPE